ncbi:uncharacterized protein LOC112047041 [Bicyclus anynana]|uniref:Uncharacterized protein LOC112047041 n=1 Tax=Bicyclus anynana TaxID=110368 RepID=A0A6J1N407_BICAN|nr:uncharacterized protein LOC112047041 [Bicyclus anynana]
MKLVIACVAVLFLASALAKPGKKKKPSIADSFIEAGFVELLNISAPTTMLQVTFNDGEIEMNMGNYIRPDLAVDPEIGGCEEESERYMTFMYGDANYDNADPEENPECIRTLLLGLKVNVKDLCDPESGDVLAKTISHSPRPGSGEHAYFIYVLEQKEWIDASCLNYEEKRINFPVANFVAENNLCDPEAGNYYLTSYPDVEEVCEEICEEQNQENQYYKYKSKRN